MSNDVNSSIIQVSLLRKLQDTFQKEVGELIDFYLQDAKKKIALLNRALEERNISNFSTTARELRQRSIDIGAIDFSYSCLGLEIAAQEMRLTSLPQLTGLIELKFKEIQKELNRLKQTHIKKK